VTRRHLVSAMREALPASAAEEFPLRAGAAQHRPVLGWASANDSTARPTNARHGAASDHFVADEAGFRDALLAAVEASKTTTIATIGITPTRAETGYGYIEKGEGLRAGVCSGCAASSRSRPSTRRGGSRPLGATSGTAACSSPRGRNGCPSSQASTELSAGLDRMDRAAALGDEPAEIENVFPTLPRSASIME